MKKHCLEPELILKHGIVRTLDPDRPLAGDVAVGGGRILAVGDDGEAEAWAGPGTEVVDLEGGLVLPGMMDAHIHYYDWALGRRNLTLADVATFQELLDRVSGAAREAAPGSWILGQGWNEADWPENRMPTRDDLDAAAPDHPVALWRCDLHLAAVNSCALTRAGIDEHTPDPPEGVIARDASGRLNGILRELAPNMIRAAIGDPTEDDVVRAMEEGVHVLHAMGITAVHDSRLMGGLEGALALTAWQRLNEAGLLDLRAWVSLAGERIDEAIGLGLRTGLGDDRLRIGHLKYFSDGGMGARTGWMIEPYLDAGYGMPLTPIPELMEAARKADRAGLAVMIHAIGDRANREVVTLFETLEKERARDGRQGPPVPHRIEHAQMIRSEDVVRLGRLDVSVSAVPTNMILDINMIDESVGERGRWTYPFRELLDAGVRVLFSSDAPVCDPNPFVAIHAAVTRQRRDGTPPGGWYPRQRISVEEAVRVYTSDPARAYGLEDEFGSISPGKRADLIVLDRDIFESDPMGIADTVVELTVFDGRIVFRRG